MSKISIMAPISIGELIDKISILNIKLENVSNEIQKCNILTERDELQNILVQFDLHNNLELLDLADKITKVNKKMWVLENDIRNYIDNNNYNDNFIRVAKNIPFTNDLRCEIKKEINIKFNSHIIEEKLYQRK